MILRILLRRSISIVNRSNTKSMVRCAYTTLQQQLQQKTTSHLNELTPSPFTSSLARTCEISQVGQYLSQAVVLCGWIKYIRKVNSSLIFLVLCDHSGEVQLVLSKDKVENFSSILKLADNNELKESVISVKGIIISRPIHQVKEEQKTGMFEVSVSCFSLLNRASNLPFLPSSPDPLPDEEIRLKSRFLDLRRYALQENIRKRASINRCIREYMETNNFVEVETPLLFKSTPEGAREFIVDATRIRKDSHFALPQSPQQFKQMLMAAGFDRYYQIARCFRDEDLRADRQPEFTQLDMEMSFVTMEGVMQVMENCVKRIWSTFAGIEATFTKMAYQEALATYGTDKPDLRRNQNTIKTITVNEVEMTEALHIPRKLFPLVEHFLKSVDSHKYNFEEELLVVSRDRRDNVAITTLGRIRNWLIQEFNDYVPQSLEKYCFLWIHDFPLLSRSNIENDFLGKERRYESMHHPFTAPHLEDIHLLKTDPLAVRGQHYDLVLNGTEIGGGSIRIHNSDLQRYILKDVIGMGEKKLTNFSHLLNALDSGCPPHGGMALGLDRIIAIICGAATIRDVIAFPKNGSGMDTCVGSPSCQ